MTTSPARISRSLVEKGAVVYHYSAGTTTPLQVFKDANASIPHTWPIIADANGRMPAIYVAYGSYRERATSRGGVVLWDDDGIPNPAPITNTGGAVAEERLYQTGYMLPCLEQGEKGGFVRLNGRSIGNGLSGATERNNSDCEALFRYLWQKMADAEAPFTGGRGASSLADWNAGKVVTLPDFRGRSPSGLYDMGNFALVPNINAAIPAGKHVIPGAKIGAEVHTLTAPQMPLHNHGGVTGQAGAHAHNYDGKTGGNGVATGVNFTAATFSSILTSAAPDHTHTIPNDGGGVAHNNLAPGILVTWYIKL